MATDVYLEFLEIIIMDMETEKTEMKSEYLRTVDNFVRYVTEDFVKGSDGERCLMVLAGDRDCANGQTGMYVIGSGGRALTAQLLSEAMANENFKEVFHLARMEMKELELEEFDTTQLRHDIRIGHVMTGVFALWCCCLIALPFFGTSWIVTVTNLLLMSWVCWQHYIRMKGYYSRLKKMQNDKADYMKEKLRHAIKGFIGSLIASCSRDDDDDDE